MNYIHGHTEPERGFKKMAYAGGRNFGFNGF